MGAKYKKRADGRYLIQIQIGIQDNGKPKYKNIYAHTIKELEEKAAKFRQELETGIIVDDMGMNVAQWSTKWLEIYKSGKEYYTIKTYRDIIKNHIIPELGHYSLKSLKPHHIQELINRRADAGLTRTLSKITSTLNQILDVAVENGYIYKNVCKSVQLPSIEKKKKRSLTEKEIRTIGLAELQIKEKTFIYTLLYTGLRKGEILALTKNDIDLINRTINVNKAIIIKSNQPEIKPQPKSKAGNRVVPIIDELLPFLTEYLKTVDSIYAFPSAGGRLMSHSAFKRMWDKVLNALNVAAGGTNGRLSVKAIADDITPHMFRHTYATMLYYAGVDMKAAQYLLGHASIQMTMDIYTHLEGGKSDVVVDKLNDFLSRSAKDAKTAD